MSGATFERRTEAWIGCDETVWTQWTLVGPLGAVSFTVRTGGPEALPWVVAGHYPTRPNDDGYLREDDCAYTGGACWSGGSGLAAKELWAKVIATGDRERYPNMAVLWAELEDYYRAWFIDDAAAEGGR